jgi:hypothetical protein
VPIVSCLLRLELRAPRHDELVTSRQATVTLQAIGAIKLFL